MEMTPWDKPSLRRHYKPAYSSLHCSIENNGNASDNRSSIRTLEIVVQ